MKLTSEILDKKLLDEYLDILNNDKLYFYKKEEFIKEAAPVFDAVFLSEDLKTFSI